jgi:membrane protease YdiL (CAAX protease family)
VKWTKAANAVLLFALLAVPLFVPALRWWPLYLLAPLAAFAAVVAAVPPLRRGIGWLRVGRLDVRVLAATAGLVVVSSAALVLWFLLARPDVGDLAGQVPRGRWEVLLPAGAVFAAGNAAMEEAVFRGVLQDALEAEWGRWWAAGVQGVAFGVIHSQGFPRGPAGMAMASAYGVALGLLRVWAGGLGACVLAHTAADATIFALLAGSAAG